MDSLYYITDMDRFEPPKKKSKWVLISWFFLIYNWYDFGRKKSHSNQPDLAYPMSRRCCSQNSDFVIACSVYGVSCRFVKKTYKLVSLKSTTPEELFARKVSLNVIEACRYFTCISCTTWMAFCKICNTPILHHLHRTKANKQVPTFTVLAGKRSHLITCLSL